MMVYQMADSALSETLHTDAVAGRATRAAPPSIACFVKPTPGEPTGQQHAWF